MTIRSVRKLLSRFEALKSCRAGVGSAALAPALIAFGVAGSVAAQAASGAESNQLQEVVVTGTLIPGIAPVGTNVVTVTTQDIAASGAVTANDVLATIPQVTSNFNTVRTMLSVGSGITTLPPSIRNIGTLPGEAASSGAVTTLVLMDGHRLVDAGVLSTSPDPDVIPPGVIERVEVMPDGASSIYGSDAVGGVINFITRKRFDGFQFAAHEGFRSGYNSFDMNATAGKDWGSGSGYLSYSSQHNTPLYAQDLGFIRQINANAGDCGAGTVFNGTGPDATSYALPGLTPGTVTDCNTTAGSTFYPEQSRYSIFGGLTQRLSDTVSFDVRAFYSQRSTEGYVNPVANGESVGANSSVICSPDYGAAACALSGGAVYPGYLPVANDTGVQRVEYNFGSLVSNRQTNQLQEFQVTPTLTIDFAPGWELRLLGAYGSSTVDGLQVQPNPTPIAGAIAAGLFNPYAPQSVSSSELPSLLSEFIGRGSQGMINARAVVSGNLFKLPGGEVRLAAGVEYRRESLDNVVFGSFIPGTETTAHPISGSRNIKSGYGELDIPVIGPDNAVSFAQSLDFSASARYDRYSDFGGTSDPKFGFTYKPVQWVSLRGNWGKSFDAPSLADTHAPDTRSFTLPAFILAAPGVPVSSLAQSLVVLVGGNPNLQPQKADTWSFGVDISPPVIPDLTASITYWNIHLTDEIAVPPISQVIYSSAYSHFSTLNPTLAQVEQATATAAPYLGAPLPSLFTSSYGPYALLDFRRNNLGAVSQNGLDLDFKYDKPMDFGSVFAEVSGTYNLDWKISPVAGASYTDIFSTPGASRFSVATFVGARVYNLFARAAWYHTQGYGIFPTLTSAEFGTQSHVDSFDTVNLYLEYDVNGEGLLKDLSFSVDVDNLMNANPPFYNGSGFSSLPGFANGSTLGRVVTFGVQKKF